MYDFIRKEQKSASNKIKVPQIKSDTEDRFRTKIK